MRADAAAAAALAHAGARSAAHLVEVNLGATADDDRVVAARPRRARRDSCRAAFVVGARLVRSRGAIRRPLPSARRCGQIVTHRSPNGSRAVAQGQSDSPAAIGTIGTLAAVPRPGRRRGSAYDRRVPRRPGTRRSRCSPPGAFRRRPRRDRAPARLARARRPRVGLGRLDRARACASASSTAASTRAIRWSARSSGAVVGRRGEEDGELVVRDDDEGDAAGHGTACAGIVRALAPEASLDERPRARRRLQRAAAPSCSRACAGPSRRASTSST